MKQSEFVIHCYAEKYSEYGEMLGAQYPQFLLNKLAADLIKAHDRIEYLEKVNHVYTGM